MTMSEQAKFGLSLLVGTSLAAASLFIARRQRHKNKPRYRTMTISKQAYVHWNSLGEE